MTARGPIDDYLDELFDELHHHNPAAARRVLAEAEDHLRESAARRQAGGADAGDAERAAIAAFGSWRTVARGVPRTGRLPVGIRSAVAQLALLAAVMLLVAGLNGAILFVVGSSKGTRFVVRESSFTVVVPIGPCAYQALPGDPPPVSYNGGKDCTPEYQAGLVRAARADKFHADVALRLGLGVVGAVVLAAILSLRRRLGRWPGDDAGFGAPFAGIAIFALLTAGLLWWGYDSDVKSIDGAGAFYSAGLAAAAGFAACLLWYFASAGAVGSFTRHRVVDA